MAPGPPAPVSAGRSRGEIGSARRGYDPGVVEPGDLAPDFELPDQDGRPLKLGDYRGQRLVVYFYPKAATPGCWG